MMGRNREVLIVLLNVITMMMVFGGGGANFQMFQLVEQWPPAYCASHPNDCNTALAQATTRFTIHGYWPSQDNGDLEVNCNTHQLTQAEITNQAARLDNEWISFQNGWDNFHFWSTQWSKHGTCSGRTPAQYFEAALALKQQYDLYSILGTLAPTTSFTKKVTLPQLQLAIYSRTVALPAFRCTYGEITEVVLCVSPGGPATLHGPLQNCSDAVTEKTCSFYRPYFWSPEKPPTHITTPSLLGFSLSPARLRPTLVFVVVIILLLLAAARGKLLHIFHQMRGKLLHVFHNMRTARAPVKED